MKTAGIHLLFLLGLVATACADGSSKEHRVEYRVAYLDGDVLGTPHEECETPNAVSYVYHYPSGREVSVHASKMPLYTLRLTDSVDVVVADYGEVEPGVAQVAVAEVVPPAVEIERANAARGGSLRCDLLITVDGKPVGIERRGTSWQHKLPGGTFTSVAEATKVYSESGASIRQRRVPEDEQASIREFWAWRRARDIWDLQCDPDIRAKAQEEAPELLEALKGYPEPDCGSPPVHHDSPEDGGG